MHKLTISRLVFVVWLAVSGAGQAEPEEVLDRALRAIKMTRKDVTLDSEYRRRDPFALKAVDGLLREPLKMPDYTQELAEELANAATLRELIERAARRLEVEMPTLGADASPAVEGKPKARWQKRARQALPAPVAVEVVRLVTCAHSVNRLFEKAYDGLTDGERQILMKEMDAGERSRYPLHEYFVRHHRGVENVEKANKGLFLAAEKFQLGQALAASALWAEAVENAKNGLRAWLEKQTKMPQGLLLDVETPAGRVVVSGSGTDRHESSPAILIDLGGDDTYLAPICGGKGCTAAIELAGDDRYLPLSDYGCGVGIHGCSVFFDCEGDDRYNVQDVSLGVGLFGVGIAVDEEGRDEYNCQEVACGVGALGIGVLIDQQGHDTYTVRRMGQAAAVTKGFGLLLDRDGNDAYFAGRRYGGWSTSEPFSVSAAQGFAGGIREYTSGGIALLLDLAGHDTYFGEAIAQGVGYWFAAGMLVDGGGNDRYQAVHYSQGSAFHFAVARLFDNGGNDQYSGSVTCQGSGYDYSAGVQVDYGGDDVYQSDYLSSGSGGVSGMGFLFDNGGNDHYITGREGSLSLGGGQFVGKRGFGCIGVFLDFGGNDFYTHNPCANNTLWTRPQDGVGLDTDKATPPFTRTMRPVQRPKVSRLKPKAEPKAAPTSPEDRVRQAIRALGDSQTKKEDKEAALQTIKANFAAAEPILMDHLLAEPFYLSFGAAYTAIPEIGVAMVPALVKTAGSGDAEDRVRAMNMLGKLNDPRSIEVLLAGLKDENYRVRGGAALGLGSLGNKPAIPQVLALLGDSNHTCRGWAAMALGTFKDPSAIPGLVEALSDAHYSVRTMAANALAEIGDASSDALRRLLSSQDPVLRGLALETLAGIAKEKAGPEILKGLEDSDWLVRASACRATVKAGMKDAAGRLSTLAEKDLDPHVRLCASQAAEALAKQK